MSISALRTRTTWPRRHVAEAGGAAVASSSVSARCALSATPSRSPPRRRLDGRHRDGSGCQALARCRPGGPRPGRDVHGGELRRSPLMRPLAAWMPVESSSGSRLPAPAAGAAGSCIAS
ncbi:hypothetical protein QJS66_02490 [Kocuria rhizophila]|nr:hypothetical protein QJS66_02490 [Kocuria rhizophila]